MLIVYVIERKIEQKSIEFFFLDQKNTEYNFTQINPEKEPELRQER